MKINPECVPCLLNRIIFETKISTNDEDLRSDVLSEVLRIISREYNPDKCSAEVSTKVHRKAYQILGEKDPYRELKKKSNEVALSLASHVEDLVNDSDNPLKTSIICSIIGNIMDFGIEGTPDDPSSLLETFDEKFGEGLEHDDYEKVENLLEKADKIVFFTDNCGEIVFDKIVCRELKKLNDMHVTLVVKGEPILSDATMDDVEYLDFDEVVDEVLTTDSFAVGIDFNKISEKLKKVLDEADLIICKGMANYEAFSEKNYKPIVYLLRTKCNVVARDMGLPVGINVIKLYN